MTDESIFKWAAGGLLSIVSLVGLSLVGLVWKNRERSISLEGRVKTLEAQMKDQLTKNDVREILEDAFDRRDAQHAERKRDWNARLALEIKQVVTEGIKECRACQKICHPSDSGEV